MRLFLVDKQVLLFQTDEISTQREIGARKVLSLFWNATSLILFIDEEKPVLIQSSKKEIWVLTNFRELEIF